MVHSRQCLGQTAITLIDLGDAERTTRASAARREDGIHVASLTTPTVSSGRARLVTIMSSEHTTMELDRALASLERVGREIGAI